MMEKIRIFIAIPLPPEILKEIGTLINEMRPLARDVKWVRPESIHLTLKFLGNLTPEELQKLFSGIDEVFREQWSNFSLQAGGVGAFPNFRRPRVLWVGLREPGMEELRKLQGRIEEKLAVQGFPKEERAFSPHLTVARIKFAKNLQPLMEKFSVYAFPEIDFPVNEVHIMKSELKPGGAVYTVQRRYLLGRGE